MDTYKVGNYTIEVVQDTDAESPLEHDEFGEYVQLACWHGRYNLGHEGYGWHSRRNNAAITSHFRSPKEFFDSWGGEYNFNLDHVVLPLYLYDHSGITIATSPFSCVFDSGQVGIGFIRKEWIRNNWNAKRVSKKMIDQAKDAIIQTVKTYDQYLRGDVHYVQITHEKDQDVDDSCSGLYGVEGVRDFCLDNMPKHTHSEIRRIIR